MRITVGISGASGVIMGYELVKALKRQDHCEVHLVLTDGAKKNFELETNIPIEEVMALADYCHSDKNMAASISSGSFVTDGMIVLPCSMKTLSAITTGYAANLLVRAVDVCLKEHRKVVLVPRELPFGKIHLNNMKQASDLGCTIIAPVLTFYNNPQSLNDQINHIIGKILMQFGLEHKKFSPWIGSE
ncbi:UbiX family flavin prenyltransferase [Paenibacillus thiaminolyticus]|uniref:UbiX family flavin prenyltransferase n=1 Tax=Paenibacillus thiaminolyticus TaxID=49283 RepID=UPI0035A5B9F3